MNATNFSKNFIERQESIRKKYELQPHINGKQI